MTAQDHDPEEQLEQKPLLGHLEDLRWMIIRCVVALTVTGTFCLYFSREIFTILQRPLVVIGQDPEKFLNTLSVLDPFSIHISIGLFSGLVMALPLILYFVAQFVLPALTKQEKALVLPVFAAGAILFVLGVVFCYYLVLPITLQFFLDYNKWLHLNATWTIKNYLDFVLQMLIGFGLAFEMPLVLLVLHFFGIVSSSFLQEYRRHAIVAIFIAACCITPSSDLFSLTLLSLPMYLFYEGCIFIMKWREAGLARREAARR
ncbi:twin-arginine translocase subunit TatC [Verrucomicrobia bacterium LW23]|nr:twin-arginine translocase subunit TatC [Verrucomicrobia bacterium LW23]